MRLLIPFPTPSLNQYLAMHWRTRAKLKSKMLMAVLTQHTVAARVGWSRNWVVFAVGLDKKALVRITRYGSRMLDDDNFRGGAKPLVDALKDAGLIVDDSPKWMTAEYKQVKCTRKEAWTEVEVTYP